MTKLTNQTQAAPIQEARHQIRPIALISAPIFQGWGPKF